MRAGIVVEVTLEDRVRLERIAGGRNTPQKHSARARVILATAEGCGTLEIVRRSGLSKPVVWRWQERFMHEGVDGLLRDKTRPPGKPPLPAETVRRVVDLTLAAPPGETTHWTGRALAATAGVSLRYVQRIWAAHGLAPHRVQTFKLSKDPRFLEKFTDVVGLYVDPPAHAVVLSVDEKSQIQVPDRTQPGLPMKKGRAGTMTHDYKRHGTTTLFAALNVLDGTVIGHCMQRHRHKEFIRFLNAIERAVPAGKLIHAIADNYATHKHPKVRAWLTTIRAGPSTSRQPPAPGSTPSRASSPPLPSDGSSEVCSAPSSTSRPLSTATSPSTTTNPSPSSGRQTQSASWPLSNVGSKR